jgi:transcriptional regulator with XRE-family HTH domain
VEDLRGFLLSVREEKGLSRRHLACYCGVSVEAVRQWECVPGRFPKFRLFLKWMRFLGVDLGFLAHGVGYGHYVIKANGELPITDFM